MAARTSSTLKKAPSARSKRKGTPMRKLNAIHVAVGLLVTALVLGTFAWLPSHGVGATPDSSAHTTCTLAISDCPYDFTYNPDKPKHQGGTVVFSGPGGLPQTLNPALAAPGPEADVTALVFSACLVQLPDLRLGPAGFKPDQCRRLPDEAADLKATTLHLDLSRKWSDGQPVTADDWLFYLNLITDLATDPGDFPAVPLSVSHIASFAEVDAATITITWKTPYALYLNLLSALYPLPVHAYPQAFSGGQYNSAGAHMLLDDPSFNTLLPVVNGPFAEQTYTADSQVVTTRNPNYTSSFFHGPTLNTIVFSATGSDDDLIAAYRGGQVGLALNVGRLARDIPKVIDLSPQVAVSPTTTAETMMFNQRVVAPNASANGGASLFADASVRKAFSLAFNHCTTVAGILAVDCDDANVFTSQMVTPISPEYAPHLALPAEAVHTAQSLLDAAGYHLVNGVRTYQDGTTPISLTLAVEPLKPQLAQMLATQWQTNLQITVTVKIVSPGHFFDTYANGGTLATGKWDIATFGSNYITPDDELTAVLQSDQVPSPTNLGFNVSGINDPVIDTDLALGRSTADADSRDAIYQSLAQHLTDTTSVLPMYMIPQVALVNPALGNYMSHPLDIDTWNAADWFLK
jgi:ABC-type transport system substrate-binding protein